MRQILPLDGKAVSSKHRILTYFGHGQICKVSSPDDTAYIIIKYKTKCPPDLTGYFIPGFFSTVLYCTEYLHLLPSVSDTLQSFLVFCPANCLCSEPL